MPHNLPVYALVGWLLLGVSSCRLFGLRFDSVGGLRMFVLAGSVVANMCMALVLTWHGYPVQYVAPFVWLATALPSAHIFAFHSRTKRIRIFAVTGFATVFLWGVALVADSAANELFDESTLTPVLEWNSTATSIVSNEGDAAVSVWNAQTGNIEKRFEIGGPPAPVSWSPDGSSLAFVDHTGALLIWNAATDRLTTARPGVGAIPARLLWGPCKRYIAAGLENGGIEILDVPALSAPPRYLPGVGAIVALAWSPDCKQLAAVNAGGGGPAIWNIASGEQIESLPLAQDAWIRPLITLMRNGSHGFLDGAPTASTVAWSPSGRSVAVAGPSSTVTLSNANSRDRSEIALHIQPFAANTLAWTRDGRQLAIGSYGTIEIWDVGLVKIISKVNVSAVDAMTWNPDASELAVAGHGLIMFCNPASGMVTRQIEINSRIARLRRIERFLTAGCTLRCSLN